MERLAELLSTHAEEIEANWLQALRRSSWVQGQGDAELRLSLSRQLQAFSRALADPTIGAAGARELIREHADERLDQGHAPCDVVLEFALLDRCVHEVLSQLEPRPARLDPAEDARFQALVREAVDIAIAGASEHECRRVRADLDQLKRERAVREGFVDTLAHDLRGPLTVAVAAGHLLETRVSDDHDRHLAHRLLESVRRAELMLRDMLDASRVRAGQVLPLSLGPCDLTAIAREVADELTLVHGPRFFVKLDGNVRGVWCARQLRRALWNLGTNAVKHGAPDEHVIFSVELSSDPHGDGAGARVAVYNRGPAIAARELERIFDPFRRGGLAVPDSGWGLGLVLVRACAEAHGGSIEVRSDPDEGTTFALRLPLDSRAYYQAQLDRDQSWSSP
ncbi:MAG TPA: sensor histidine kinase [Polyangia bacterium]|nr:sensor histidine kinase [Polyangia bacterium]